MLQPNIRWRLEVIIPALFLTTHVVLLLISSRLQFPTRNEVAHVPAGLSHWHTGKFSLYNVNPPLWKLIATLPTLLLDYKLDSLELPSSPGHRPENAVARKFANDNLQQYFLIIWSARLAGIGWSVLGGLVIFRWSTDLYGRRGGLLALALWCFGPNILAHAPLATPDIPATVSGLVATYGFWRYLRTGDTGRAAIAGMLLGIAELTKFTMLILYGVWPILAVIHALEPSNPAYRSVALRVRLLHGGMIFAISLWVINVGFLCDGSFISLEQYQFVSRAFTGIAATGINSESQITIGNRFRGSWIGAVPVPLPFDYLTGIDVQSRDFDKRLPSYLAGEWRDHGWWYYYLYASAIKIPLGTLALATWGLILTGLRSRLSSSWANELTLWLPAAAILTFVSSQTGFNHHSRYVLPMLPFVCIAAGKLGGYLRPEAWRAGLLVVTLLGWSVVSSLSIYPHSLSYFNELAGGPDRGYEYLVNSNIDWGQDLYFFKEWVDKHPEVRAIGLAYYTYIDYRVAGVEYGDVPPAPDVGSIPTDPVAAAQIGPRPGWFGVDTFHLTHPAARCHYFLRLRPVAKAGYSIFIYHITPEEANQLRRDLGLSPLLR